MIVENFNNITWITMENIPELTYKLRLMFIENGITIQKYYWRSLFDATYLELREPTIYDAFQFHIDVLGNKDKIQKVLDEFISIQQIYRHLDKCLHTLTEKEIQEISDKAFTEMFIFQ